MSTKIKVKGWGYRGCTLSVYHVRHVSQDELDNMEAILPPILAEIAYGDYCGYVKTAIHIAVDDLNSIDVHGGITYTNEHADNRVYGFDCGHYGDTIAAWTLARVAAETERLADGLLAYEPERDA